MHLTLPLGLSCLEHLPDWVQSRIQRNLSDNAQRFSNITRDYEAVANALSQAGVDHLVLKGFAQWPVNMLHPRHRMCSDLDLFCPPESVDCAIRALGSLGYKTYPWAEHFPSDQHLPTLRRSSDWQWRGNYFDPEMPVPIDLHLRFWNDVTAGFGAGSLQSFWTRRVEQRFDGCSCQALHPIDSLAYSTLHAIRHLLCDSLGVYHIYEVAWFLQFSRDDRSFWHNWRLWHDDSLRRLEAICFALAKIWFQCSLPDPVKEEIRRLPSGIRRWLRIYPYSPLKAFFQPNKDSLWLHLSLLESTTKKKSLLRKRLFGSTIPSARAFRETSVGSQRGMALGDGIRYLKYVSSRASFHARTLPTFLAQGVNWWLNESGEALPHDKRETEIMG
jgi:hypothetical protein